MMARPLGRVLLTGAGGFLGTAVLQRLRADDVEVLPTDAVCPKGGAVCDVTDVDAFDRLIADGGFDTIVHLGAVSGPMVMADRPLDIWRINAGGTANVLEAARRHGRARVVTCSTSEVYGAREGIVDETTPPDPQTIYAASKLAGEQAMTGYVCEHGVDAVALRLSWIYGPGRRTPTTLEALMRAGMAGATLWIDTAAGRVTHYLALDDAVSGVLLAATTPDLPHRIYNITAGPGLPMGEVVATVASIFPSARLSCSGEGGFSGPSVISIDRAAADLGYGPRVSLAEGLRRCRPSGEPSLDGTSSKYVASAKP